MPVITIREEGKTDTGFQATLKFDAGGYQITITDPFTPQEEKQPLSNLAIAMPVRVHTTSWEG